MNMSVIRMTVARTFPFLLQSTDTRAHTQAHTSKVKILCQRKTKKKESDERITNKRKKTMRKNFFTVLHT